jgi:surface carbohydrate biosynthesis protein (TIGR04326 family)
LAHNTKYQMRLLSEAKPLLPDGLTILVKPHPAFSINPDEYPELNIKIITESLSKILSKCDFVFTSAVTSAAVDAYCSGLPVVSALDQSSMNLSPLRGCLDVHFATSPESLARIITVLASKNKKIGEGKLFFNTNNNLGLWSNLLMNG